ncbi:MAG: PAS domain-containing sensor histidine kinase, partial [Candidatus Heimdallarchaeota archaeon]|nr:PAS domain-containing sensor histidine kinase [Candidatus Heimdallarchaeota archaeon]
MQVNKSPFYGENGEIIGIICVAIDITDQKRVEDELKESQSLLNNIMQSTNDGIIVLDDSFRFLFVNDMIEKGLNTSKEKIIKNRKVAWEQFPILKRNDLDKLMKQAMKGETVVKHGIKYQLQTGNQGYASVSFFPLYDAEPKIIGIGGIIHDTTEEEQMKQDMEVLAQIANTFVTIEDNVDIYTLLAQVVKKMVGESIVTVNYIDDDSVMHVEHIEGMNQRSIEFLNRQLGKQNLFRPIYGITEEASQGLISGDLCEVKGGLYEIFFRNVPKSICKTIEKHFRIRKFYSIGLRRKDRLFGNVTIALQSDKPINKNSIETVVNQASVVLEKREHQQKIIQMNKNLEQRIRERTSEVQRLLTQKDAFIYQLGHDLKTPLGPLIQLLPILETKTDDPDCMEILKVLKRNVSYINSLVSKTLRFIKLTDSDAPMQFEQVDLRREIQDVLSRFSVDLEKKNI